MSKITDYTALTGPASNDVLPVVDVSDTTMATTGTTKKITVATLIGLDATATDIQPLGAQAAGATGKPADAGHVHPTTGVALTGSANTFTADPQSVGTAVSSGQIVFHNTGQMTLGNNGGPPPGHAPPAIKLYGYCGGATGLNGWDFGIDVSNHGGGQDFYFGKLTNTGTTDFIFINYATTAIGIGSATPPDDTHLLQIRSEASDTMGVLSLGLGAGATGNVLTLAASSAVPQIWVDSAFRVNSVAGGGGVLFVSESTSNRCIAMTDNGKTKQFAFEVDPVGNSLNLRYVTGGTYVFFAQTSGALKIINNVGFYNNNPVSQPTAGGVTAGFTAGAGSAVDSAATFTGNTGTHAYTIGDIVKALKNLGLIQG